jgi:glycine cleavage system H protein
MTAGLLAYQLCDRNFDCENCLLDKAMRMHFIQHQDAPELQRETKSAATRSEAHEYLYSRNHWWIHKLSENSFRIGIEPTLSSLLLSPREIVLPRAGEPLRLGRFSCWIIIDNDAFPLASPVSGTVLRTNKLLQSNPQILCTHPLTQGWLFEVESRTDETQVSSWMTRRHADKKYQADFSRFNESLSSLLRSDHPRIGTTIQDGGQIFLHASKAVGTQKYVELLFEAFGHELS